MNKNLVAKIENAVNAMTSVWEADFMGAMTLKEFDAAAHELATELPIPEFILDRQVVVNVHDGLFHADDVLCVAMLERQYGAHNVKVLRTRNDEAWKVADFILDNSREYPELIANGKVYLDHHDQEETKAKHENGIYKCAADKLASFLGYPEKFWIKAMYGVSALDNGQKTEYPNPFSFIDALNVVWTEGFVNNDPQQEAAFEQAVEMAGVVLDRIMKQIDAEEKALPEVFKGIDNASHGIAIFPCYLDGWLAETIKQNKATYAEEILIGIFRSSPTEWKVQCIPVDYNTTDTHVLFPKSWHGKSPKEIEEASDIKGATFCVNTGWISGWTTLGAAKKAAMKALEEHVLTHFNAMLDRLGISWGYKDPAAMNLFWLQCRLALICGYDIAGLLDGIETTEQLDTLSDLVDLIAKQAKTYKAYITNEYPERDVSYEAELDWREDTINDVMADLKA